MTLTPAQFARAAAQEEGQQRVAALHRMSYADLHRLLGDPKQAAVWIRSAAEQGTLPAAQLRLGRMLLEGIGVPKDAAEAFTWFERAASRGDAEAHNMIGRCLENGLGVVQDFTKAAEHYRLSAEAGHDWGEYNFGNLLFDGRGIAQDPAQALRWYLKAAEQGHGRAMNLAGRCLEEGWGCERSRVEAAYWYARSAETGYFRGQFNHALTLLDQGDAAQAVVWLAKAIESGDESLRRAVVGLLARATDPKLIDLRERVAAHSPGNRAKN